MTTYERPPESFDELVEPFPGAVRDTAHRLRQVIRSLIPEADEKVYGGLRMANVLYSIERDTNVICGLGPTETHCKLYLHHVKPGDVAGVKIEGSGKNVRHIKVSTPSEAGTAGIRRALELARHGARERLSGR